MTPKITKLHYGWIVLAMATLVVFGSLGLARFGYSLILPSMQEGLGLDNTRAGGLATANLAGYLILSALGGALAARYGPRVLIATGLAIAGVGMVLTGMSQDFAQAAVWRGVTGAGSGASNVPVMGLLAAWFGARRRGLATGIAVAGSSLALILLGKFVPLILTRFEPNGWRISWYLFGGATGLLAVLSWVLLRNRPHELGLAPVGDEQGGSTHGPGDPNKNLQWGRVYRSRLVWHLGLVYAAFGFSYIIYVTFFVKSLIADAGYTREAAGQMFLVIGWCSLLCGVIWGSLSDVIGRKYALMIVYLIHAVSFTLFATWTTRVGFTVSAVLFGLTAWSIPGIMAAACGDLLGPGLASAALGFITLFFGIGQALAPSAAGAIADATGSFAPAYYLAAAVALLGALGAWLLRPQGESPLPEAESQMG